MANIIKVEGQIVFTINGIDFQYSETLIANSTVQLEVNDPTEGWTVLDRDIIGSRNGLKTPEDMVRETIMNSNAAIKAYFDNNEVVIEMETFHEAFVRLFEKHVVVVDGQLTWVNR